MAFTYQLVGFDLLTGKLKRTIPLTQEQFVFVATAANRINFHPQGGGYFELTDAQAAQVLAHLGLNSEEPILWSVEANAVWPKPDPIPYG